MEKGKKGALSTSGSQDVLNMVLETPEHRGQLRELGQFVTPTSYFGRANSHLSYEEVRLMKERVKFLEETMENMQQEIRTMKELGQTDNDANMDNSRKVKIHMEAGIIDNKSRYFYLMGDDILQFCKMEEISITAILTYMRLIYEELKNHNMDDMYRFVDPSALSEETGYKNDHRARELLSRMMVVGPHQLLLLPFNAGAFTMFADKIGKKDTKFITWRIIKCPHQPTGVVCGYYVMRNAGCLFGKLDASSFWHIKYLILFEIFISCHNIILKNSTRFPLEGVLTLKHSFQRSIESRGAPD
ncbi:hypothetical protein Q3G72_014961 [Acer saccharum]|nr:hypothetical protein Q3G72_014961 [Acer saccharum]